MPLLREISPDPAALLREIEELRAFLATNPRRERSHFLPFFAEHLRLCALLEELNGKGNRRVVEKALAALPGGIAKVYLRGDSALYEHELMRLLGEQAIGYAISADMSPQLPNASPRCPRITGNSTGKRPTPSANGPRSIICPVTASGKRTRSRRAPISPSASARARASCCATATACATSASSPTAPIPKAAVASI
jgi:hypothetical protein